MNLQFLLGVAKRKIRRDFLAPMAIFSCGLSFCQTGKAQQHDERSSGVEADISTLKEEVKTIGDQQRQIIDQLNEVKRLLAATPYRPALSLPTALDIRGEASREYGAARVAIIEYSDFECPYCGKYERETSPQILKNYIKTGKVKFFYRDLPLPMHPHAISAARAARCAGEQGKYWEMHDSLFANQTALSDPALVDRAQTIGLDSSKFSECFSSERYTEDIQKSMSEAQRMGIDGTPTFFIGTIGSNGDVVSISKRIVGAYPYETFQSALDELLASKGQEATPPE